MGRQDESTILNTSVPNILVRIIDAYIEQQKKKRVLTGKRMSRASVMEDALLDMLYQQGVLEQLLKEQGVPAEEIHSIKARLQAEHEISRSTK